MLCARCWTFGRWRFDPAILLSYAQGLRQEKGAPCRRVRNAPLRSAWPLTGDVFTLTSPSDLLHHNRLWKIVRSVPKRNEVKRTNMATLASERADKPWRRRLYLPTYQVAEAARYAHVSARTVAAWHRADKRTTLTLSNKGTGEALSYLQFIEVGVVAAFRKLGVPLSRIRATREYIGIALKTEFPFAAYRFKTDGKSLFNQL
jgi:hypothetical protein